MAETASLLEILSTDATSAVRCVLKLPVTQEVTAINRRKKDMKNKGDMEVLVPELLHRDRAGSEMGPVDIANVHIQHGDCGQETVKSIESILSIHPGRYHVSFSRKQVLPAVLNGVASLGDLYGYYSAMPRCIPVAIMYDREHREETETCDLNLSHLRLVLTSFHCAALLRANGYETREIGDDSLTAVQPVNFLDLLYDSCFDQLSSANSVNDDKDLNFVTEKLKITSCLAVDVKTEKVEPRHQQLLTEIYARVRKSIYAVHDNVDCKNDSASKFNDNEINIKGCNNNASISSHVVVDDHLDVTKKYDSMNLPCNGSQAYSGSHGIGTVSCPVSDSCVGLASLEDAEEQCSIQMDLRRFLLDQTTDAILSLDKNIGTFRVEPQSTTFAHISELEAIRRSLPEKKQKQDKHENMISSLNSCEIVPMSILSSEACLMLVNVVLHCDELLRRQTVLSWQALVPEVRLVKQVNVVCGMVIAQLRQKKIYSAREFMRLRLRQIRKAFVSKYGDSAVGHDSGYESTMKELVKAGITFDLLSTVSTQQTKLDLSDDETGNTVPGENGDDERGLAGDMRMNGGHPPHSSADSRGGIFVMYNLARLMTLFSRHEDLVTRGVYPKLPDIMTIDFSVLHDENEWELVYSYILPFPDLVADCLIAHSTGSSRSLNTIHTHKICQYLSSLVNKLSAYYCKTHILCEGREHLLPLMHARLHLLQSIQQVIVNALRLLNIKPCSQL